MTYTDLQKALAIAMDSRIAMMGMMMIAAPSSFTISPKPISSKPRPLAFAGMEKGGGWKFGTPPSISPVNMKVQL